MIFNLVGYRDKYKDYYKDAPLEDVAKDAYTKLGFNEDYPDYDTWKKSVEVEDIIQNDLRRRNPPKEGLGTELLKLPRSFLQGAAEGITTELPSMVGGAIEFAASHTPFKGIEETGKSIKDWAEEKRQEVYGPEIERTGLDRIVYEGTKMLAPSLIPGGIVGTAARGLKGVSALAKVGKMAEATAAARSATNIAGGSVAGLFGLSQAQQTKDTAEKEGIEPGIAPYLTGAIEAAGEFLGTKYLAKLFRLDEAEVVKRGIKELTKDLIKTVGVEVGTEIGQAGGEAAVEKFSGIRPSASPIGEAIDVIGPTTFMTLLTAGLAGGANKLRETDPESARYLEKMKIGAIASMSIKEGLETGQLDGDPFTPENAIEIIREGQNSGIYDSDSLERFKERYPQLRDGLNGVIAEGVIKKIDEVASPEPRPDSISQTMADMERIKKIRNTEEDVPEYTIPEEEVQNGTLQTKAEIGAPAIPGEEQAVITPEAEPEVLGQKGVVTTPKESSFEAYINERGYQLSDLKNDKETLYRLRADYIKDSKNAEPAATSQATITKADLPSAETVTEPPVSGAVPAKKLAAKGRSEIINRGFPQEALFGNEKVTLLGVVGNSGRRGEVLGTTLEDLNKKAGQLVIQKPDGTEAIVLDTSLRNPETGKLFIDKSPAEEASQAAPVVQGVRSLGTLTAEQAVQQYKDDQVSEADKKNRAGSWDLSAINNYANRILKPYLDTIEEHPFKPESYYKKFLFRNSKDDIVGKARAKAREHGLLDIAYDKKGNPFYALKGTAIPEGLYSEAHVTALDKKYNGWENIPENAWDNLKEYPELHKSTPKTETKQPWQKDPLGIFLEGEEKAAHDKWVADEHQKVLEPKRQEIAALDDEIVTREKSIKSLNAELEKWQSKKYKNNEAKITTGDTGSLNDTITTKTIGEINEGRRKRNIANINEAIENEMQIIADLHKREGAIKKEYPDLAANPETSQVTPVPEESALFGEAKKYKTAEEFEKAFLTEIKHGRYWHITDSPNFTIDPNLGPRDMSSLANGRMSKGKFMITSDLEYWAEEYPERQYVAEIDMINVNPKDYYQVKRGFGNEFFVDNPANARVIKVVPLKQALKDSVKYQKWLGKNVQGFSDIKDIWNKAHQKTETTTKTGKEAKEKEYIYKSPYRPLWIGFHNALGMEYKQIDANTFSTSTPLPSATLKKFELEALDENHPDNIKKRFNTFRSNMVNKLSEGATEIKLDDGTVFIYSDNMDVATNQKNPYRITRFLPNGTPAGHDVFKDFDEVAMYLWGYDKQIKSIRTTTDAATKKPEVSTPTRKVETEGLRYDPSTNRHNGAKLTRGDILVDDEGNRYSLDRDNGFMLTAVRLDENNKEHGLVSFSVDPSDKSRFLDVHFSGTNIYDTKPETIPPVQTQPGVNPVVEIPVDQIKLSKDVPQFKTDADERGIVQEIQGKEYRRVPMNAIIVWQRKNGDLEVITGRHRLDLAKRLGEKTIPAQIVKESEGFDAQKALTFDAEQNILDNQGTENDYANYFRNTELTEKEAGLRGLLRGAKASAAWILGKHATDQTFNSYSRTGEINFKQAVAISKAAPSDERLQAAGRSFAVKNPRATDSEIENFVHALSLVKNTPKQVQGDLFGFDDSAIRTAEIQAKKAAAVIARLRRDSSNINAAIRGEGKLELSKEGATEYGIKDPKDKEQLKEARNKILSKIGEWEKWYVNPELVKQLTEETTLPPVPKETPIKTEKTEAGEQSVIPGASAAETFNLTNPETEISPKLREQVTPKNEEMFGAPKDVSFQRGKSAAGLQQSQVQSVIDQAIKLIPNPPKVNVVQSNQDCPEAVQRIMERDGIDDAMGFTHNGEVYLVSDNIKSEEETIRTLAHELTHSGLGKFFQRQTQGKIMPIRVKYEALMDAIYHAHGEEVEQLVKTTHRHLKIRTVKDRRQACEEWLCNQSYDSQPKWYDKLVAIFNDLLRAVGLNVKLSDAEVRVVLQDAFKEFGGEGVNFMTAWHGTVRRSQIIPLNVGEILTSYFNVNQVKVHKDYINAKSGDKPSATRLVRALVKDDTVAEARARYGQDVLYAYPHALESTGTNMIPAAMANYYAKKAGGKIAPPIVQTNKAYHTGAGAMERMITRPSFEGDVVPGGRYVLVDDATTLGGTFAEMTHHIQSNGGTVVGIISLTNASRMRNIVPQKAVIKEIERRFGNDVRELFGIEPSALTAAEAGYIIGFRNADTLRNRATKAISDRRKRLLSKGILLREKPVNFQRRSPVRRSQPMFSRSDNPDYKWWEGMDIQKQLESLPLKPWQKPRDFIAMGYVPITRAEADKLYYDGLDIFVAHVNIKGELDTTGNEGIFMRPLSFYGYQYRRLNGTFAREDEAEKRYWEYRQRYNDSQRAIPDRNRNTEAPMGRDSALREEEAPERKVAESENRYSGTQGKGTANIPPETTPKAEGEIEDYIKMADSKTLPDDIWLHGSEFNIPLELTDNAIAKSKHGGALYVTKSLYNARWFQNRREKKGSLNIVKEKPGLNTLDLENDKDRIWLTASAIRDNLDGYGKLYNQRIKFESKRDAFKYIDEEFKANSLSDDYAAETFDSIHTFLLENGYDALRAGPDKVFFQPQESLEIVKLSSPTLPPEAEGQTNFQRRPQQDPPVSRDPKVLNLYLKDETDALIQTMMNKLHPPYMTWLETILKSPEWFGHPQIQNIVKLFMRDRNEIYHETFNDLNMADDINAPESTVTEAAKALKNKGLSMADRLTGKVSPEYQRLQEIIDEGDTSWKRNISIPLDRQIEEFEKHIRQQGATEDTIRVWKLYRQSYDKALDLQTAQLRQMIDEITEEANFRGEKPDLNELRQTLKGALAQMEEWRGFYAPRLREQGNWKVQAYKEHGPMKENREWYREHRGSELSARRLANKMQREGWKIFSVGQVEKLPETIYQDINATATAKLIDAALEKLSKKSALSNELTLKFNEEVLREVSNAIKARGFRSTMIRRGEKIVRGFIEDPIQRHLLYTNNLSGGIAKARVARMAMTEMLGEKFEGKQIGGIDPVADPKAFQVAQNYIEEQLRNVEPIDRMIGLAKSIATFKFLGFNLRSLAVNTTAIVTTAPAAIHQYALGGKGSLMGIIKELAISGKDYASLMAGKKLANADEQAFLDDVQKKGWDDAQYTREALGEISKTHSRIWSSMMDGSMYLFGKSEKWNRGTTMLAAYRLARKQGMGHGEAAEVAKEASDKAHGVYGKSTMPMWAQGTNPAAKIGQMFYVYQKFGHNYLQMLYHMGVKKHNIKAAMFAFLSPLVLAGGAALPFKDAIFSVARVILSALFGEDRDPEKWVWDEIRKHLGLDAEKVGRHGLTGALGVDISGSLSAGVGIPKNFIDLTGAIGGVVTEIKEAKESIGNKQYGKAAEHLLPTGFANPIRAIREAEQGVTTRNNRRIWDEQGQPYRPSPTATAARTFGFRSTDQAVLSERTWEGHRQQADFADKRNAIYERYRAWTLGKRDREEYKEIVKEVRDYNKKIRELRISGVSPITSQSLQNQARRMAAPSKNERALLQNLQE